MKKTISLILLFITIISLSINITNADDLRKKLYRSTILTTNQVKKDYWKTVNKKIVDIFVKYRYDRNIDALNKLETLLKSKIQWLNKKSILTSKEKKLLNLYNNLYFRAELLLKYDLK